MELLRIGQDLNGTIVKFRGGKRFDVRSKAVPLGWTIELHTREPEKFQPGDKGTFWVARITPLKREVLVHEGEFGRLPISAQMAQRYLASIEALLGERELTGDLIGDAIAMLSRIGTQNQSDWFSVWRMLGEPNTGDVKVMLAEVQNLRTARKEKPDDVAGVLEKIQKEHGTRLAIAVKRLNKQLLKAAHTEEP